MRIQSWQGSLFLLLALLTAARVLRADSVMLQPSADTSLFEDAPTNNLGGLDMLVTGTTAIGFRSRALIKFDIAGHLPANATVTNALLRLTVVRTPSSGGKDSIFRLYRVVQGWEEGDKAGTSVGAP